jgi:hypothetical protein
MHVLDYFQRIYVINLAHRHDRRREMARQLDEIGLTFDSPGVCLFEAIRPDSADGFPSIGARGCFLSHLGILQDARKRRLERILILEDDLNFAPDFPAAMNAALATLKQVDWSIFYGGYAMETEPQPQNGEVVVLANSTDSIKTTHFVAFRGQAITDAVEFLETVMARPPGHPKGGPMHVDGAYGWFRYEFPSKATWLAVPQLGYQRSSRTDIHPLQWFDRIPRIRWAIEWLRQMKNRPKR